MIHDSESSSHAQERKQGVRFVRALIVLCILSAFFFLISISVGRAGITDPIMVLRSVFGQGEGYKQMMLILSNIRIPRACASFLVGACLAISGLVYQTTFNNKLVSPDILGVSSGCCVGAGIAILLIMAPMSRPPAKNNW